MFQNHYTHENKTSVEYNTLTSNGPCRSIQWLSGGARTRPGIRADRGWTNKLYMCIDVYIYTYTYIYIYIYVYLSLSIYIYIYTYIRTYYIYIYCNTIYCTLLWYDMIYSTLFYSIIWVWGWRALRPPRGTPLHSWGANGGPKEGGSEHRSRWGFEHFSVKHDRTSCYLRPPVLGTPLVPASAAIPTDTYGRFP